MLTTFFYTMYSYIENFYIIMDKIIDRYVMKKNCNFLIGFFCLLILNQSFIFSLDSKTFFRPRSIIEDVSFFLGLNQYNYYRKYFEPNFCDTKDQRSHIAVGAFFIKSRPNFGKYFFSGGINANEEILASANESIISVRPERKVAGTYFDYHHDFCDGLWFDIKFAVYQAKHNLHAKERIINSVAFNDCTPLSLLSGNELKFGKLYSRNLKKVGIDDIEIKFGYYPSNFNENGYIGLYASAILPSARKPRADFLFEPLVGRGHWGAGIGLNLAHNICRSENSSFTILTDFSYQYLFKRSELRSLDFKQGQLTRFIIIHSQDNLAQSVPAINLTTLNLKVVPRGIINFWLAPHFQYCNWHAEVGYNLWWRQSEKICFTKKCHINNCDNLGFFDENNTFIPLTLDNLDLSSAKHPRTLTNKIYLALSSDIGICCNPINIGLAGSYEFSKKINSMEQWAIWGNLEISF